MPDTYASSPFPRTTCACRTCVTCCREQPGSLAPGQLEAIAEHLGQPLDAVLPLFWASPGALVMNSATGRQYRIGTITPRYLRREQRCVFLDPETERCRIHPVAPAGCALADTHMGAAQGQRIATWLARAQASPAYQALRARLPFADSYRPKGF